MTDVKEPKPSDAEPSAAKGKPEQALSGGGSDTRAGSDEGGSAYGDDREDDAEASVESAGEEKTFASPDGQEGGAEASTEAVNNTGEPRPVKNREGVEGQPGDDVDAASG